MQLVSMDIDFIYARRSTQAKNPMGATLKS